MSEKWPGGFIKPIPPTPAGPYQDGAASGVWTMDQMSYWLKQGLWPIAGNAAPIALFGPGSGDNTLNVISRLTVATLGNATDFGDYALSFGQGPANTSAFGSNTRCIWSGGQLAGSSINNIAYSTYSTSGNATDFGDLTVARYDTCGMSNSVRGVTAGGYDADRSNVIDYVTIASTGNAVDFGDASGGFYNSPGGLGSSTRGVFALGYGGPSNARTNIIEYITIASTGNSTDFGDLTVVRNQVCGASNNATGIWCGGRDNTGTEVNVMDYVTISSIGNATDFGDLTQNVARAAATASSTRLVRGGGAAPGATNVIDYVEIASTGNATDFGDLVAPGYTGARSGLSAACSGASAVQPTPTSSAMAVIAGGRLSAAFRTIQYLNIATTGDSYLFGDLSTIRYGFAGCSSSTRGIFSGGTTGSGNQNIIEYVTISSVGNATDFGDLLGTAQYPGACSSETRGVIAGGGDNQSNVIQYVTIASAGNSTDFGDLSLAVFTTAGSGSSTRGLFNLGSSDASNGLNIIEYITIASAGNSTDFGDLTLARWITGSCSNSVRSLTAGGLAASNSNVIDYVTIASAGNSTDFGDLITARYGVTAAASTVRAVFSGGSTGVNVIQYVTIASAGDATDFGDLVNTIYTAAACSNAHGGL